MVKQVHYTKVTPLPSNVPRLLALDLLHSHDEFIRLNPLVTGVKKIDPPRTAEADEYFSDWYEISEIITWGLGLKKKLNFKGCFYNQDWGMQSHIFVPMGVEFRNKYRIGGNQPGEPREARELGVNTPADGLYLREDISFTCQVPLMAGYIKKEMQEASGVMINRMTRKAELLDEGKLHAMFEDGKLKTSRPAPSATFDSERPMPSPTHSNTGFTQENSPLASPDLRHGDFRSPGGFSRYDSLIGRNQSVRSSQHFPTDPPVGYPGQQFGRPIAEQPGQQFSRPGAEQPGQQFARPGAEQPGQQWSQQWPQQNSQQNFIAEMPGSYYHPQPGDLYPQPLKPSGASFRAELPGDSTLRPPAAHDSPPPPPPPPNAVQPAKSAVAYDSRQQPSNGGQPQYQAYQAPNKSPQRSPHPSPRMSQSGESQSRHQSTGGGGGYQVANPDRAESSRPESSRPESKRHASHSSVQEWQRSVQNDAPIEESYYRNSRASHGGQPSQPDHDRMSKMSIQESNDDRQALPSRASKCPVCGLFEGDETAVSHHVSKAHFPQT